MSASQSQGRDEIFIEAPAATVFAVLQAGLAGLKLLFEERAGGRDSHAH